MRVLILSDLRSSINQRFHILKFCYLIFLMVGCSSVEDNFHLGKEKPGNNFLSNQVIETQHVAIIKGQVNYQRGVTFYKTLTLTDAIKRCSGFTEFADLENVKITRGKEILRYDFSEINENKDIILEPNDVVEVPFKDPNFQKNN